MGGGTKVTVLQEGAAQAGAEAFWALLPGERKVMGVKVSSIKVKSAEKGGGDEKVEKFTPQLMRLRCSGESVSIVKVGSGEKPSISKLDSGDVFLYDTGFRVWLWVGKGADRQERIS